MFGILLFCTPTRLPIPRIDSPRTCVAPPCPQSAALSPFKTRNAQQPLIGILPNRQLDLEEVHFHVGKPEQLQTPILQQHIHGRVFRLTPAMLDRAQHTGKLGLPVPFPNPHQRAPTRFVPLHKVYLLTSEFCRSGPAYPVASVRPTAPITRAHVPELPSFGRFTPRKTPPSFPIRGTSKARRSRPRSARPSPSSWDVRRFSLPCQRALSRYACLHPAPAPPYRYAPRAIPRRSPPCCRSRGAGTNLQPQPLSLSLARG